DRERDYSNFSGESQQNEQSLAVNVKNLGDGYSRAAYRTTLNDFRSYRRLELFVHAEAYGTSPLKDNDVNAFIRVGADNQDNYYECSIPLKVTSPGTQDPSSIWPDQNKINIELKVFQNAKIARNSAKLPNGQPWPINVPYTFKDGVNTITILGQPDLSKVRVYMLGVSNPLNDGLENSAQVWFNELRLTDFDEGGGWAANARLSAKLADFADVSVSGAKSTVGFGSIDKRVSERNRTDNVLFDISSNMELGKFFPARIGIKLPVFINFSSQVSTPQYDPRTQDIELKNVLKNAPKSVSDSILFDIEDYTTRKSINLINVRKIKTNTSAKNHLWDIENLSLSYSYNEFNHRDFINEKTLNKNYRAGLAYTYSNQAKFITPFGKLIKSKNLALLRDFNFSLMPSALNFRVDVDRLYSENTLRNNDPNNFLPINTNFNKNFQMTRFYGLSWNLTKAVQIEFNANNFSVIDEPEGRITALARDTIIENLKKLGRTTDYSHTVNVTYAVPINKLPGLDWVTLAARYGGSFNWKTEPLITLRDPNIDFGNTIQNSRNLQLNPTLSFTSLYNKFGFIRKINSKKENSLGKTLITALTGLKNISGSYNRTDGTFLPGYLPKTDILGQSFDANAPGYGFVFGSQQDIRGRALANGWITRDPLLSQLYVTTRKDDLNLRGLIEPFKDLRIELTATRSQSFNYSTNFRFSPEAGGFQNFSPVTSGDFSISYFSLFTSFSKVNKDNSSNLFKQFESNRSVISQRLGAQNPNSAGTTNNFADGYGKNSQDVLVSSFLAAYSGKSANSISLNRFPKIPVPNWRITYNGLAKYAFFEALFSSIDLNHSYRSTYNVNGFNSLIRYQEQNGAVNVKDVNDNFLPYYQFSQITIAEQFVPLLGVDVRLKNNMTTNFEYRKSRTLGFSLSNSQLAEQKESAIVFGLGYRTSKFRFPFGILKGLKLDNDMNFKFDFALNDRKTLIYRADVEDAEVSSGAKNITFRPSVDYVLNQRFNVRVFYDGNITRPYTSQTFNTSFSNFGLSLRFALQ
ncbi:MAG: cell surface protein SprA, partial [Daejeonella sp.]